MSSKKPIRPAPIANTATTATPATATSNTLREPAVRVLVLATFALFGLRWAATRAVGFGDSEALYACYALHPAPAYLDHPGLVGIVASLLGSGGAPTPERVHSVTAVVATLLPWLLFAIVRLSGASVRAAALAALALLAAPEIGVGLFALTPDLLLAPIWILALGAALAAIRGKPAEPRTVAAWIAAGLLAGAAGAAKASGVLLMVALAATLLTKPLRAHARTTAPWVGLVLGGFVLAPVVTYEMRTGYPMLRHRLFETQAGSGLSLLNLGALVGGQLAYVSPLLLMAALWTARPLGWLRSVSAEYMLLFVSFVVPVAALVPFMAWSRAAEPHWLAPAYLSLPIAAALMPSTELRMPRWLAPAGIGLGLAMTLFVHFWVLAPDSLKFARPADPKIDIANELFGWDEAERSVREMLSSEGPSSDIVVVGPHWTICAQIHARLGNNVRVGCMTPIPDDFDRWLPRAEWQRAEKLIYLTDARFPEDPSKVFPDRTTARRGRASIFRGGRLVRTFTMTLMERAAHAAVD